MSAVASDPRPIPTVGSFVIGEPVRRVDTLLLPFARLPDLLTEREDDRPSIVASVAKLAAITLGVGGSIAAGALGVTFYAARLLG